MRVLFVEDDKAQIELLTDAVSDWNNAHAPRSFEIINQPNVQRAEQALEFTRIDAALFDLRLPPNDNDAKPAGARGGNDLAQKALSEVGVPIAIVSGNPSDLDENLRKHNLLECFNKGDPDAYNKVLSWLDGLWSLMEMLGNTRQKIQKSGAQIFSDRLWPRWKEYSGLVGVDQEELGDIVSRQYVGHIAERLGIDGADNVPWHPYEAYLRPAMLEHRTHTGDIFSLDDGLWVVLTPQCDMAQENVDSVLLASVDPTPPVEWAERIEQLGQADLNDKKTKSRDKFFRDLVNQNISNATHFLPPLTRGESPLTVRFGSLIIKPLADLNAKLSSRVASVAPAFLPNLTQRFGAFISRTGQPDIAPKYFQ